MRSVVWVVVLLLYAALGMDACLKSPPAHPGKNSEVEHTGWRHFLDLCYIYYTTLGTSAYYPSLDSSFSIDLRLTPQILLDHLSGYGYKKSWNRELRPYLLPMQLLGERIDNWPKAVAEDFSLITGGNVLTDPLAHLPQIDSFIRKHLVYSSRRTDAAALTYTDLKSAQSADCIGMTKLATYICRGLGVPAAIDFTNSWGNFDGNLHCWSTLFDSSGREIRYMAGEYSPQPYNPFLLIKDLYSDKLSSYKLCAKVFRGYVSSSKPTRQFSRQLLNPCALTDGGNFIDVTDQYMATSDVYYLGSGGRPSINVYRNGRWWPAWTGQKSGKYWRFTKMARGMLYIIGVHVNSRFTPYSTPFVLDKNGKVNSFIKLGKITHVNIKQLNAPISDQFDAFSTTSGKAFSRLMHSIAIGKAGSRPVIGAAYDVEFWENGWKPLTNDVAGRSLKVYNVPGGVLMRIQDKANSHYSRPFVMKDGLQHWF